MAQFNRSKDFDRRKKKPEKHFGLRVVVTENMSFEKALRLFKKKVDDSGLLKELRDREHYVKPKTARKMAKNAARKRWLKYLESQELPPKNY